jgi:hypothetical protein
MAEHMCQNGNCTETDTPVLLSLRDSGTRVRFCGLAHLLEWIANRIEKRLGPESLK